MYDKALKAALFFMWYCVHYIDLLFVIAQSGIKPWELRLLKVRHCSPGQAMRVRRKKQPLRSERKTKVSRVEGSEGGGMRARNWVGYTQTYGKGGGGCVGGDCRRGWVGEEEEEGMQGEMKYGNEGVW